VTDATDDRVTRDVESIAVVGDAPNDDIGVGVAGAVIIRRHPVRAPLRIALDLFHQLATKRLRLPSHAPSSAATMMELVQFVGATV
jgi:hypothetical protein